MNRRLLWFFVLLFILIFVLAFILRKNVISNSSLKSYPVSTIPIKAKQNKAQQKKYDVFKPKEEIKETIAGQNDSKTIEYKRSNNKDVFLVM